MKRHLVLAFLPLILVCLNVFGEVPAYQTSTSQQPTVPSKDATLTARICPDSSGIYFTGDFIWWRARGEELFFAAKVSDFQIDANGNGFIKAKDKEVSYEFDPGWKLGIGGNLPWDGWDIYLNWTHFHNHPTNTLSSSTPDIIALFGGGNPGAELAVGSRAKGSWNVMFNAIDFNWGRLLYFSHSLTVRPSFGGKVVWIHQRLGFKVEDLVGQVSQTPFPNNTLQATNKYWGIGPYFGIRGLWNWAWGFGLYGEIGGALFWGEFDQNLKLTTVNTNNGTTVTSESETNTHRVRPSLQMFVGLDWRSCVYNDWLALNFRAGWEVQYYWSQFANPFGGIEESDFSLEGLTVTGRIDF